MGLSIGISADGLPSSLWVHQDDLVLEGTNIPAHCEGAYLEPKLSLATDGRLIDGHIQARADSVVYREQGDSVLTGNVRLAERERRVHTELAILGGQADRVSIPDGATFFEPGTVSYTHLTLPTKRIV